MEDKKRIIVCDMIPGEFECDAAADYATVLDIFAREFWEHSGLSGVEKRGYYSVFASFVMLYICNSGVDKTFNDYCAALAGEYGKSENAIKTVFRTISTFIRKTNNQGFIEFWNYVLGSIGARYYFKSPDIMECISGYIRRQLRENGYVSPDNPRYKNAALIGPRIEALPKNIDYEMLMAEIENEIISAVDSGRELFYAGMYGETALLLASCVLRLKNQFPQIKLNAVLPYEGCENCLNVTDRLLFAYILENADDKIIFRAEKNIITYNRYAWFLARQCERAIFICSKNGGGLERTYNYTYACGADIRLINPEKFVRRKR